MRSALVLVVLLLAVACSKEPSSAKAKPASTAAPLDTHSAPPASVIPPAPSATASTPANCLSPEAAERDLGVAFKLRNELAVVRVAPNDVLVLREKPGAHELKRGELAHDARGVRALGSVCRVGSSTWFHVALGNADGWANDSFLAPATKPKDETDRFKKLLGTTRFPNDGALVAALQKALERELGKEPEPRFEAKLVGTVRGTPTVALLYLCCFGDDSVMGEQVWLELAEKDGTWTLVRAHASRLCPRGTSGDVCT